MGHKHSVSHQCNLGSCGEPCPVRRRNNGNLYSGSYKRKHSQPSSSSTMSKSSTPTLVYQRKRRSSISTTVQPSDGCHSAISSEAPSLAAQENVVSFSDDVTNAVRSTVMSSEVTLTTDIGGNLNACSGNDNYSSSKSNLEHSAASLKIDTDDAGECSSSGGLIAEKVPGEASERGALMSILRDQNLFDKAKTRQDQGSNKNTGISRDLYSSKSCKVCERTESTSNLLLCDCCEDAFHPSCHRSRKKRLSIGEWLCNSCSKKKRKILNGKSPSNSGNNSTEIGGNQSSESEDQFATLEFMLSDTEPYLSSVRIGSDFQTEVPDWCGPVDPSSELVGIPLEVDSCIHMEKKNATKPPKLRSIGNWIQCREAVGGEGSVCGKWRRAPLFEVQTEEWECFRCILWDPAHADCAVAQEVDTEEVMRQLKYIEMLKSRVAAKRRKMLSWKRPCTRDST